MSHIITGIEEIEEHGACQQRPVLETGERYLHEVEGKMSLRIVRSVHFDRYVWENVAQWRPEIEEFFEDEYTLGTIPLGNREIPVFLAEGLIGVLSCETDQVRGELVLPAAVGQVPVRGVAPFGFFGCKGLTQVSFAPMIGIVYEYAFAQSGIRGMAFNDKLAIMVHLTAIDGCDALPKFDPLFDRPFPGMYMFRGGQAFREWEDKLCELRFLVRRPGPVES